MLANTAGREFQEELRALEYLDSPGARMAAREQEEVDA
jgi:hypothetical protein